MDRELGNGATAASPTPVQVSNLGGIVSLTAGVGNVFAVLSDGGGTIAGWGINSNGQLGQALGSSPGLDALQPMRVQMLSDVVAVSGGALHACALLANGGVECWGDDSYGQLGDGQTTASLTPVAVRW